MRPRSGTGDANLKVHCLLLEMNESADCLRDFLTDIGIASILGEMVDRRSPEA